MDEIMPMIFVKKRENHFQMVKKVIKHKIQTRHTRHNKGKEEICFIRWKNSGLESSADYHNSHFGDKIRMT